jgi:type III pantothenate kinase
MEISAAALFAAAARLTRVEYIAPSSAIGRNTVTAVQSGIIFGTAGLVDGLVERVVAELGGSARIVATGGLADVVKDHCKTIELIEPALTLIGLRHIYELNADAGSSL